MDFLTSLQNAMEVVRLNRKAITTLAKNDVLINGLIILAIAGLLGTLRNPGLETVVPSIIGALIASVIGYGLLHLFAKLLGGKGQFMHLYRVGLHASILNWLAVLSLVPALGFVLSVGVSIWGLVVGVIVVETLYKLSRGKAIAAVLLPMVIFFLLIVVLGTIVGLSGFSTLLP